jgi:hypothetical protein
MPEARPRWARWVRWLNHGRRVPISIGMTLFPSALRSHRPPVLGTPAPLLPGLKNLVTRMLSHRRSGSAPVLSVVVPHAVTAHANGTHHERAEPRLRFTDSTIAPNGDFAASAVTNAALGVSDVPRRGEAWETVSDFALSYDGYGYWDDLPELASRVLQTWTRRRALPSTLDELRGCLFYEQRRWHHFGEEPTGRSAEYMWALVDAIAALATPLTSTTRRIPDPRRGTPRQAHVRLLSNHAVALRPVPSTVPAVRARSARQGRLVPVPAAEAHVRLVSAIEDGVASHPSGYALMRSNGHRSTRLSGNPAQHPSMSGSVPDLKPMPSADPLPKPSVIVPRSRRTGSGMPNRAERSGPGTRPTAGSPPSGSEWRGQGSPARQRDVTPLCHEFRHDHDGYLTWVETHPDGFVLNQPRTKRAKAPTLHRVGCGAVARRGGTEALAQGTVRVCGPTADALTAWSVARGVGPPTACRRCCP